MKKRVTSLFLAVMMIFTVASTAVANAVATTEETVTPRGPACMMCQNGSIRTVRTEVSRRDNGRAKCSCYTDGRYNCKQVLIQYRIDERCDNCGYVYQTSLDPNERTLMVHDVCKGSGCGH